MSDLVLAATNRGVTCSRCGWTGTLHMGHECREIQIATLTRRVSELEAERDRLVSHIREALALMMGRTQREGRNVESVPRGALSGPPNTEGGA